MSTILGLDIGSHSIKAIELERSRNIFTLLAAGSVPTPTKTTSNSTIDLQSIAYTTKQLERRRNPVENRQCCPSRIAGIYARYRSAAIIST